MKNKKAQIGATLTWIVAFLIIFFIIILFLSATIFLAAQKKFSLLSIVSGIFSKIEVDKMGKYGLEKSEAQKALMIFLNTPVQLDGKTQKIADIILYYKSLDKDKKEEKEKYKGIIQSQVEAFFNNFVKCYHELSKSGIITWEEYFYIYSYMIYLPDDIGKKFEPSKEWWHTGLGDKGFATKWFSDKGEKNWEVSNLVLQSSSGPIGIGLYESEDQSQSLKLDKQEEFGEEAEKCIIIKNEKQKS